MDGMLAVQLHSGTITVQDTPQPARPPGFALIQTLVAGICNTDLELQRGYYGFSGIPGHEFVGRVIEADTRSWIGERVVGEINLACSHCDFCATGLGRHCPNRTVLGIVKHPGAFAGFLTLPEANLHIIPSNIPDEQAVFVEPLAAACEILDQVHVPSGEHVAVLGDGKLGLLIAQVLHTHGAHVTLFGRHEEKLRIARKAGIATSNQEHRLRAAFQLVVDATGSAQGLKEAIAMTRPRGTLVMKSTVHADVPVDTAGIIVNEITLMGSRCGRFEPAIELLAAGKIDVASMLSSEFPLRDAPAAFVEAARPGILKVLLRS